MSNVAPYNFRLVQGDSTTFELFFFEDDQPLDLTDQDDIIWSFRRQRDINQTPFEVKSISNGKLEIFGDDNNGLRLTFERELYATQEVNFVHALLFIKGDDYRTYIGGQLINNLNAVRDSDVIS